MSSYTQNVIKTTQYCVRAFFIVRIIKPARGANTNIKFQTRVFSLVTLFVNKF